MGVLPPGEVRHMSVVKTHGPLVTPLVWFGIGRATSEWIDRFIGRLTFCFFPVAPVFWLIGHFVGGGRVLFAIWVLLITWYVKISWQLERRRKQEEADETDFDTDATATEPLTAGKAKGSFWKYFAIDVIVMSCVTYIFDLSAIWLTLAIVIPLIFRKQVIAYMMAPQ